MASVARRMTAASTLLAVAQIAVVVAIVVPLAIYLLQDRLIFFPQPLSAARRADIAKRFPAVEETFIFGTDGTRLHAWIAKPGDSDLAPLVIYFGGNAEEVSWMLEAVGDPRSSATPHVTWVLADYRGYGASEGSPSEAALLADAVQWYDHAIELPGVDPRRVFAFGRSLGSGVAVQLAAARPLAGVILVTPYDSLAAVAKHYYPYLPVDWMLKHRFDSIAQAPRLTLPLLCVIAERDEVIPPKHAESLYEAWAGPKRRLGLGNSGHNNTDSADHFWPGVREFLGGLQG